MPTHHQLHLPAKHQVPVSVALTHKRLRSNPVFYTIWALVTTQLGTAQTLIVDDKGRTVSSLTRFCVSLACVDQVCW